MPKEYIFVVHKHKGRVLHYDFRIEIDGVLKSWAVPKGISLNPANKRLAILTTDHALEYSKFEGYIEEGSYGAGPVIIWDNGTIRYKSNPQESFKNGKIEFELEGQKLKGGFVIFTLKGSKENWLIIKQKDKFADNSKKEITEQRPESVVSNLTLEEIEKLYKEGKIKPYSCK
jgi:bifunctional non-homologous end joining protein LigD